MARTLSPFERFKLWLKDRRIAAALDLLRRDGELQRILDESPYTYLRPGSFQGDGWYHIHRRGADRPEDIDYSSLKENDVLWWIVQQSREGETPDM